MNATTTLRAIRQHNPCKSVWDTLAKSVRSDRDFAEPLPLRHVLEHGGLADAIWALRAVEPSPEFVGALVRFREYLRNLSKFDERPGFAGLLDLPHLSATNPNPCWLACASRDFLVILDDEQRRAAQHACFGHGCGSGQPRDLRAAHDSARAEVRSAVTHVFVALFCTE